MHFPQLCIDKINQVQEIINDVQLNYVDNLDKFTESRCLEEYTTQFGINSLKKSTFSIYFKLAQCMSPLAKECMKQACSEVGREISNQRSLDDLRKFLCEKGSPVTDTDTFIKRIVTCLKNWVLIHETPLSSTFFPSVLKHFSVWTQLERNFLAELSQEKLDTTAETIINENLNNFTWSHDVKHRELEKWSESLKEDKCFLPQY